MNLLIMVTVPPDTLLGTFSWIRWSLTIGAGLGVIVGYFEVKSIEEAVIAERERISAEKAEEKKELLSYLNATLRHEILNTASVIVGYSDHILAQSTDNKEIEKNIEIIKTQTQEMEDVIEDVRLLLRSSQNNIELAKIDIIYLLQEEIEKLESKYPNIEITLDAPSEIEVKAQEPIRRALSNILHNAVEHNDTDSAEINISIKETHEKIHLDIKDNGPGISDSELESLFSGTVRQDSNHGLGLVLTNNLIESYDGELQVLETGPTGTTFRITLLNSRS